MGVAGLFSFLRRRRAMLPAPPPRAGRPSERLLPPCCCSLDLLGGWAPALGCVPGTVHICHTFGPHPQVPRNRGDLRPTGPRAGRGGDCLRQPVHRPVSGWLPGVHASQWRCCLWGRTGWAALLPTAVGVPAAVPESPLLCWQRCLAALGGKPWLHVMFARPASLGAWPMRCRLRPGACIPWLQEPHHPRM